MLDTEYPCKFLLFVCIYFVEIDLAFISLESSSMTGLTIRTDSTKVPKVYECRQISSYFHSLFFSKLKTLSRGFFVKMFDMVILLIVNVCSVILYNEMRGK